MAGYGGASSSRGAGASLSAAATAAGSAEMRFPRHERRRRWGGCFGGISCFGSSQKGGKRIVPASRIPDGNTSANRANGPHSGALLNQDTALNLSLFAPPSSPASFTNSPLPSTAQSPNCFLSISANSPGGPSSAMYATGPYAHETQLVSPPVFSTYTTEPSTAPLTPPPELSHFTTPSSPDVPFARFLSSSLGLRSAGKENGMPFMPSSYVVGNDFQATYPLYPGSPSSSLISPASGTPRTGMTSPFPDSPHSTNRSSKLFGLGSTSRDYGFFCPATSAQFYLDQAQQSFPSYNHCGGKLNVAREADAYSSDGNRHNKPCKQDVEEIEAYRASFGFSADEIIATQTYVEISEPADDSFSMSPFANNKLCTEECTKIELTNGVQKNPKKEYDQLINGVNAEALDPSKAVAGKNVDSTVRAQQDTFKMHPISPDLSLSDGESPATASKAFEPHTNSRIPSGQSCSDAEMDYKMGLRDGHGILARHDSLP